MSEVRLVIREPGTDWSGTIHGSMAMRAVAALSADPMTLAELEVATERFAKPSDGLPFFHGFSRGYYDKPHDAGIVMIDLVARVVADDNSYASVGEVGYVDYHDGRSCTNTAVRYHVSDEWLFRYSIDEWQNAADDRQATFANRSPVDVRSVLYGQPMLEFIARKTFAAFARRDGIAARVREQWIQTARERLAKDANTAIDEVDPNLLTDAEITPKTYPGQEIYAHPFYDTIKQIHAAWMLTPRKDCAGECPRSVALANQDHLARDLQDRSEQWSAMGTCPRGLDRSSHAYQYGGLGTHELVMYYDLVRALLWSCWNELDTPKTAQFDSSEAAPDDVDAFAATEVARLENVRERWLDTPNEEFGGTTPRSIIERERARLPETGSAADAIVDPDCPCCQMLADMPGPVFWHFDGSAMDDDFAFDLTCETREEWQQERDEWEENFQRFEAERNERERLGIPRLTPPSDSESIWMSSYSIRDEDNVPLGVRLFGLGCNLAELIVLVRGEADRESTPPEAQQLIDQLNRDFGNLREILQNSGPALAEALFEPVIDHFANSLANVALERPDLGPHCDALTDRLATLLDEPPPMPADESFGSTR